MAIRDDFAPGEVLAAADLNDTFASKAGTASPTFSGTVTIPVLEVTNSIGGAIPSPNRNLLYNGAMQVAQRGTSTTGITSGGYYTADRWLFVINGTHGTWTQSVENDGPTGSGLSKSYKLLCTTADSSPAADDLIRLDQVLEGQDLQRIAKGTALAKELTLSFWVKSNVTGTYVAALSDADNTRQVSAQYTISASATWEKKTVTFPADITGSFDNDNAGSLRVLLWLGAGSNRTSGTLRTSWTSTVAADLAVGQTNLAAATNNYWQITGVQLEVGDTATPFEFKSYGQELAECQRYYYRLNADAAGSKFGVGFNGSTTAAITCITFPTVMRTNPTALEQSGTAGDYSVAHATATTNCSSVPVFNNANRYVADINLAVASGLTTGQGSIGRFVNTNGYLAWSAEL